MDKDWIKLTILVYDNGYTNDISTQCNVFFMFENIYDADKHYSKVFNNIL